jgi:predicted phage gp36 major capsid-like protein
MRTTLNLDDDALKLLREYSQTRSLALGKAASELVRRGANAPVQMQMVNGFWSVVLPKGGKKISTERVKQLLEDEF